MKPGPPIIPFTQTSASAHWPADIPHSARWKWKGSRRNFSAVWRVSARMGFESLRIDPAGCFLVLVVVTGSIRFKHGSTEVGLWAGQAAAVSVDEFEAEIFDPSNGDCVFVVHLFHRMGHWSSTALNDQAEG